MTYHFRYWRYGSQYTEDSETLIEAIRSWCSGEDAGSLSGSYISDDNGDIAYDHANFMRWWTVVSGGDWSEPDWKNGCDEFIRWYEAKTGRRLEYDGQWGFIEVNGIIHAKEMTVEKVLKIIDDKIDQLTNFLDENPMDEGEYMIGIRTLTDLRNKISTSDLTKS